MYDGVLVLFILFHLTECLHKNIWYSNDLLKLKLNMV